MLKKLLLILTLTPAALMAGDLQISDVEYLGYFSPPANFAYWQGGLDYLPGCLGRPDPSPDDGFPGCILAAFKEVTIQQKPLIQDAGVFGVFEVVPATAGGDNTATLVVDLGSLVGDYARVNHPDIYNGKSARAYDFAVNGNLLHIQYMKMGWGHPKEGNPFYTIVDLGTGEVLGMWPYEVSLDRTRHERHPNKYSRGMFKIPQPLADLYFDGLTQGFSSGQSTGSLKSSAGPSFALRLDAWGVPGFDEDIELAPVLYYYHQGYPELGEETEFHLDGTRFTKVTRGHGGQVVGTPEKSAYLYFLKHPFANPNVYPHNDPNAGPTNDPNTLYTDHPERFITANEPAVWYGTRGNQAMCEAEVHQKWPSVSEYERNSNTRALQDCKLFDPCSGSHGPHSQGGQLGLRMVFYSLPELASQYRGEQEHHIAQPYATMPMAQPFGRCATPWGTTYDEARGLLFVGYANGALPFVQVFKISGPPTAPCGGSGCQNPNIISVNSTLDETGDAPNGSCTLREAVLASNSNVAVDGCPAGAPFPAIDQIRIPAGHYLLTLPGQIEITEDVELAGEDARLTTIEANPTHQIFSVHPGSRPPFVTFAGLTLRNARGLVGGAIWNRQSTVIVTDCAILENEATLGGGIANEDGILEVYSSTFEGNATWLDGVGKGAAISNVNGQVLLHNSTVSGNFAFSGEAGGAIYNAPDGFFEISQSTITNNNGNPDEIYNRGTLTVNNSVLDDLCGGAGSIISEGGNVESANTCSLDPAIDQVNANLALDTLADNGGPTLTHALLPGSAAIDFAGSCDSDVDQRGAGRLSPCDSGAYEDLGCALLEIDSQMIDTTQDFVTCNTALLGPDLVVEGPAASLSVAAGYRVVLKNGFRIGSGASVEVSIDPALIP